MSNEVGHVKSRSKCFSASPATPEHPARRNVYRALSPDGAFVFALTELLGPFPFILWCGPPNMSAVTNDHDDLCDSLRVNPLASLLRSFSRIYPKLTSR